MKPVLSKTLLAASVACAFTLGLSAQALAATIPAGTVLADKQEFVRNNGAEPETLDPALAETNVAHNLTRDLFEGLTAKDNEGRLVPGVAESWRQVDPTTWTFRLRANATWSNGDPVTAEDFVYAWRRFLDPKTASKYASTFAVFVNNGTEITKGTKQPADLGIRALDRLNLEIKTPYPVGFMPELVSNSQFGPTHKATIDKHGKEWTKPGNLVGNGAYVLKEWQVNSKVVMEKNPRYWDARNVVLTRVTYLPVEDGNADLKLFQSGEVHWMNQLPPGSFDKLKAEHPKEIRNSTLLGLRYYSLLASDPLLKDVRVRKALSMVLDRNILADKITADGQIPAYSVIVKGLAGAELTAYDWVSWPMERRVTEAKKLLAEAGVAPGTKLKFAYNTSDYHKQMAIFAGSEWKNKLGLDLELENMEFKVLLERRHKGTYQIARNGWGADYNDATNFLTLVQCDSEQNDNKNCNKAAEALITQGNNSTDPATRSRLLTQAARMIMDDYPMIPLLQTTRPRLIKSFVGGFSPNNSMDVFRSKELYLIKQ
jgi:oligopeptide transport system substrate-binding protein